MNNKEELDLLAQDFHQTVLNNPSRFNIGSVVWLLGIEPMEVVLVGRNLEYNFREIVAQGQPTKASSIEWFYQVQNEWIPEKVLYSTKEQADEVVKEYKTHLENLKNEKNTKGN